MSIPCPEPLTGRRREIAAAARSLVAERGFEGLRTRDIADRVGINVATLHYHVPSKDALIELLAESLRDPRGHILEDGEVICANAAIFEHFARLMRN